MCSIKATDPRSPTTLVRAVKLAPVVLESLGLAVKKQGNSMKEVRGFGSPSGLNLQDPCGPAGSPMISSGYLIEIRSAGFEHASALSRAMTH